MTMFLLGMLTMYLGTSIIVVILDSFCHIIDADDFLETMVYIPWWVVGIPIVKIFRFLKKIKKWLTSH